MQPFLDDPPELDVAQSEPVPSRILILLDEPKRDERGQKIESGCLVERCRPADLTQAAMSRSRREMRRPTCAICPSRLERTSGEIQRRYQNGRHQNGSGDHLRTARPQFTCAGPWNTPETKALLHRCLSCYTLAPTPTYDNIIWNTWFTSNTEESVVTTAQGNHVVVAVHGGGIFASPERFEQVPTVRAQTVQIRTALPGSMPPRSVDSGSQVTYWREELPDGTEIPVFPFDEFKQGITDLPMAIWCHPGRGDSEEINPRDTILLMS